MAMSTNNMHYPVIPEPPLHGDFDRLVESERRKDMWRKFIEASVALDLLYIPGMHASEADTLMGACVTMALSDIEQFLQNSPFLCEESGQGSVSDIGAASGCLHDGLNNPEVGKQPLDPDNRTERRALVGETTSADSTSLLPPFATMLSDVHGPESSDSFATAQHQSPSVKAEPCDLAFGSESAIGSFVLRPVSSREWSPASEAGMTPHSVRENSENCIRDTDGTQSDSDTTERSVNKEEPFLVLREGIKYDDDYTVKANRKRSPSTLDVDESTNRLFHCPFSPCSFTFKRRHDCKRHIRSVHTHEKIYVCTWPACSEKFVRVDALNTHEKKHCKERPIKPARKSKKSRAASAGPDDGDYIP